MNGIYFKDGIYLMADKDKVDNYCVFQSWSKPKASLYEGRVEIFAPSNGHAKMIVNGIKIIHYRDNYDPEYIPFSTIVSHLNAIEIYGVEAFLENYKKSIEFIYGELKEMNQKTESLLTSEHDDTKVKRLLSNIEKIRYKLFSILLILFNLYTNMSSALENEKVFTVYQSIMDSFS